MTTDNLPSTAIELQREVAKLRQQNDEHRRLASFQQQNPVSTFECDLQGQLIYHNPAAQPALTSLGEQDGRIFLPDDLAVMGMSAAGNAPSLYFAEKRINTEHLKGLLYIRMKVNLVKVPDLPFGCQ